MSLAGAFLSMADPSGSMANDLAPWGRGWLQRDFEEAEALTCALMRYSGASWDSLATHYGVSRQSLHRRMAPLADEYMDQAEEYVDVHRRGLQSDFDLVQDSVRHLEESLWSDLTEGARVWQARRQRPGWWRNPPYTDEW
jgi:hypothetical protein